MMIVGVLIIGLTVGVIFAAKGTGTFLNAMGRLLGVLGIAIVAYFVLRWGITEYYITTHCTMVLGTRVCQ